MSKNANRDVSGTGTERQNSLSSIGIGALMKKISNPHSWKSRDKRRQRTNFAAEEPLVSIRAPAPRLSSVRRSSTSRSTRRLPRFESFCEDSGVRRHQSSHELTQNKSIARSADMQRRSGNNDQTKSQSGAKNRQTGSIGQPSTEGRKKINRREFHNHYVTHGTEYSCCLCPAGRLLTFQALDSIQEHIYKVHRDKIIVRFNFHIVIFICVFV